MFSMWELRLQSNKSLSDNAVLRISKYQLFIIGRKIKIEYQRLDLMFYNM